MPSKLYLVLRGNEGMTVPAIPLKSGDLLIGRTLDCDIYLNDLTVSRNHAMMRIVPAGVFLTDLKSLGGTWVDGERIDCLRIHPGQEFQISKLKMVISHHPSGESRLDAETSTRFALQPSNRHSLRKGITDRQLETLGWILKGHPEKVIATKMEIAPNTVHNHVKGLYQAYGVHSKMELIIKVFGELNLPPLEPPKTPL